MANKNISPKYYSFFALNILSSLILIGWIFKNCINPDTGFTSLVLDFFALVTCIYSVIRVSESLKGNFKVLDMVTIYYASLFFLFSWFSKMLYLIWDHVYANEENLIKIIASAIVFVTLLINFYVTEKVNLDNLDKIEADM